MLVLSLPAFENKKYTAYDRFHRNGPYGEIPTEKEPIRMLGFTLPYNKIEYLFMSRNSRSDSCLSWKFDELFFFFSFPFWGRNQLAR